MLFRARRWTAALIVPTFLVVAVSTAGCDSDGADVVVFAASSLTVLADDWRRDTGLDLSVNVAGSGTLVAQLDAGADADVFVAADETAMEAAVATGRTVGDPVPVAANQLVLAVPAGNPGGVRGLSDLARSELLVGLCDTSAPCGRLASAELADAGVEPAPDTEESSVRSLVAKLAAGEVDAGLVYRSDVAGLAEVEVVEAAQLDRSTLYRAALIEGAGRPARDFLGYLAGPRAARSLEAAGFAVP